MFLTGHRRGSSTGLQMVLITTLVFILFNMVDLVYVLTIHNQALRFVKQASMHAVGSAVRYENFPALLVEPTAPLLDPSRAIEAANRYLSDNIGFICRGRQVNFCENTTWQVFVVDRASDPPTQFYDVGFSLESSPPYSFRSLSGETQYNGNLWASKRPAVGIRLDMTIRPLFPFGRARILTVFGDSILQVSSSRYLDN